MLSQGEEEAFDLISKCRFIDNHLPDFLKSKRDPDQKGLIGFPDTGSEIVALPSTEKAGRSTDATIVVADELEFHPYAETNFAALKPTIDTGGQFIALSTADKTKMNSFFKQKYLEAKTGNSQFVPIFLSWNVRPGRDAVWLKSATQDLRPWQVEQEYPTTEKDALETLKSIPFFNPQAIQSMYIDVMQTLPHELVSKYTPCVNIFKLPVVGKRYMIFTDPSDGKEDPHAIIVMDAQGEEVASSHGYIPADQCAMVHDSLTRLYNAFNTYELNSRAGGIFTEKLKGLETPNQMPFIDPDGKYHIEKKGWWTGSKNKNTMLWGLEEAVRLRQVIPHRRECLDEFSRFMKPEGEEPQAPKGGHDDFIIAWGGVWQLRKYIPAQVGEVKSYHYKRR